MTTARDVAEATGYAVSTVSNVLNDNKTFVVPQETRRIIKEAAARLGYRPNYFARALRRQRSYLVGVTGSLFGCEVSCLQLRGIVDPLRRAGYVAFFADTGGGAEREEQVLRELCHKQIEGLIVHGHISLDALERVAPETLPCVLMVDREIPGRHCVVADRAASMEQATRRLLELGHTRIALAIWEPTGGHPKVEGFRRAMQSAGLWRDGLLLHIPEPAGSRPEYVARHRRRFEELTAVLCADDQIAAEIIAGLAMIGRRVPQDCSVVGYDDADVAVAVQPRLTTLRQPRQEAGELAVKMLLDLMAGRPVTTQRLPHALVERESTGPCPAA
ncbi:MAG TPA: LacI family DNA-binding transcriptional regulator [Candidatus Brocadiia bacterium]|nr:LacI family DNA-binding transcriptional regulator [Candidatus Brocadiia bacterium]